MGLGQQRSDAWHARHGTTEIGLPIDPSTGLMERRPGQVYMQPYNQWGAPEGWISGDEYEDKYNRGWTWQQILAASTPFLAGGIGALAGGGSAAAANGGIYGGAGLNSGPVAVTAATGTPIAATTAGTAATTAGTAGAAGAAAKGAGMGFGIKDAIQFAPMLASLFGGHGDDLPPQNDAMNDLIGLQTSRMRQADPLYQAVLAMAMGLVPKQYRQTMAPGTPPATTAQPRTRIR